MIPLDLASPLIGMAGMTTGIARPATSPGLGSGSRDYPGRGGKRRSAPGGGLVHQFARDREELSVQASAAHAG